MQKHNGKGDIRILCQHHSRADARNSYEVGSRLEIEISACDEIAKHTALKMRRRKPCRLESDHADHASNGLMLKAHLQ